MTGSDDGPVTRDLLIWAARRTVRQHVEPVHDTYQDPTRPRCPHCAPDGSCGMRVWGETLLRTEGVPLDPFAPPPAPTAEPSQKPAPRAERRRPVLLARPYVGGPELARRTR